MFAFDKLAFSVQAFSPEAFAIDVAAKPAPTFEGGRGGESAAERERLFREHWDYLDGLREIQVQIADDRRGVTAVSIPTDMPVPENVLPRAMRGKLPAVTVADVIEHPETIALLALLIYEADD